MGRETTEQIVRASEVGQYAFCARAWWLGAVEGRPSANEPEMAAGETAHRRHGQQVRSAVLLSRLAYVLLVLATVAILVYLIAR